ncbi:MAG: uroporphyrinogen-III C-methyltransferase [Coriobacteriia bacterium]|nr:uroporphyrinogen-III C-methyltransferase [Coriobacteriia bacterium]
MNNKRGFVYLTGAGPGNPDLLTLKAKQVIEAAEVIIYDQLVSPDILSLAKPSCELLFVGKTPGKHYRFQGEINDLLIQKALSNKVVVRLKGGDPFVFGRGGEEALALSEQGIGFEIVPGISSAIAVPAYAGIPVTHRTLSSSFMVITGHEDPDKPCTALNWEAMSQTGATLVFLMGMANVHIITSKLIECGMDAATPVAVIQDGSSPRQQTICGCLSSISQLVKQHRLKNPAVIIVGEVVGLRKSIEWFEKKPLFGKRILVTRTRKQASRLSAALCQLGAQVVELPTIALDAPPSLLALSNAIDELDRYSWLVFTSANGVEHFFGEFFSRGIDIRTLVGIQLAAIGSTTQKALEAFGLRNILVPKEHVAESLAQALEACVSPGERVLLVKPEHARDVIAQSLTKRGVQVSEVAAYQTLLATENTESLLASLQAREFDAITFTSSSTAHNLVKMINNDLSLLAGVELCSIGPVTSDALREHGLTPSVQATVYSVEGLVEAMARLLGVSYNHDGMKEARAQ